MNILYRVIFLSVKYEILKKEIKNHFPEEDPLVKYNITYPEYVKMGYSSKIKEDGFAKRFNGFYELLSKRFEEFSKTKLYKEANRYKALCEKDFEKFGAVMRYICSYSDEKIISIVVDVHLFCGEKQETKRLSQNWDLSSGRMLVYEDFFDEKDESEIIIGIKSEAKLRRDTEATSFFGDYEKKIKKGFNKNNFYLTPKGYGFFYPPLYLSERESPEVFFLLGFKGRGKLNPY